MLITQISLNFKSILYEDNDIGPKLKFYYRNQ